MQTTSSNQEGVSPVIGVILMVAITVILAAVIGTFVLGFADQLQQNPQAVVTFDEDTAAQTVDVRLSAVQAADSIWVESNDIDHDTSSNTNYSGGVGAQNAGDPGPSITNGGSGDLTTSQAYLLNRNGDGGVGTVVSVDYSGNAGALVQVIGEVGGNDTIIQDQTVGN